MVSRRTVRWASIRSTAAAGEARRPPPRPRPAGRARAGARSRATGRSRPTRRRARAAAARGRTRGGPSRTAARCRRRAPRGSAASQRSTVGAGQRPPGRVQPGDAEQAQDRALLADGGRGPRPGAPRAGERVGLGDQPVERTPVGVHRVHVWPDRSPGTRAGARQYRAGARHPSRPIDSASRLAARKPR